MITTGRAKVGVVDEQPVFRMGLRSLFERAPDLELQFEASTGREALAIATSLSIDIAIVDSVRDHATAVAVTKELRRVQPDCKIVALTSYGDTARVAELLRAGASGCIHKAQPPDEILDGVHRVLGGERYVPPDIPPDQLQRLLDSDEAWPLRRLTNREREIFQLVVAGHTNESIANRLFIAKRTVETHRHHIMRKLDARSLVDLVQLAVRHGIARA